MKEQILTLERTDDLHSMRDKIARTQAGRLILLWNVLEEPLTRRLDLALMARWAAAAGSELAVVSTDGQVLRLARAAGIACYPTLTASALAGLSTRSRAEKRRARPKPRTRPTAPPRPSGRPAPPALVRIGWFAAAALSIAGVLFLLLPSAKVHAVFPTRTVAGSESLDPSYCRRLTLQLTLSGRRVTGGRLLVPTAYAAGEVTLTNISVGVLNLAPGLLLSSDGGILFETLEGIQLLPARSQSVSVRAAKPGPQANLAAGMVNRVMGPLGLSLKAENFQPMSGGAQDWRNSVTASDLAALQTELAERMMAEAKSGFENLAGAERMAVEGSLRVTFDPQDAPDLPVHSAADSVGLTLHGSASLSVCPAEVVRTRARTKLAAALRPGETLFADDVSIRLMENSAGAIMIAASGSAVALPNRMEMAAALQGRSPDQAASILRGRFGAMEVRGVEVYPDWLPCLPLFPFQIEILAEAD
ncbi:MAG: hypothetical protein JW929_10875 [Anaerolineales bacterium]|nr:hypothetical protein [Anaerolineales bacterium]